MTEVFRQVYALPTTCRIVKRTVPRNYLKNDRGDQGMPHDVLLFPEEIERLLTDSGFSVSERSLPLISSQIKPHGMLWRSRSSGEAQTGW